VCMTCNVAKRRIPKNRHVQDLAPDIQGALEPGRQLPNLLKEAGLRYLRARKRERISSRNRLEELDGCRPVPEVNHCARTR
jgi:hypothetical protein